MLKTLRNSFPAFLLVVLLGLSSCNKDEIETVPLGSVNINMYELLTNYGRDFGFQAKTDLETYPISYQIRKNIKVEGNKITVNLLDIEKIEASAAPEGSASTYVPLGVLSNGEYDIQINVVDKVNNGKLNIFNDFYTLIFNAPDSLTINDDTLRRVPNGALWGYLGYMDSTYAAAAQSFIDTLMSVGATPLNVAPGNYGYFQYSQGNVFTQPVDTKYTYTKEYFLQYSQAFETLSQIKYFYDFQYRQIYIGINWFYLSGKKSAVISPNDFLKTVQLPNQFE